jgi:nitroreductase
MRAMEALELLASRASNGKLGEPGPDAQAIRVALRAASRAPDHATLRPWRVRLVRGAARERLGEVFRDALKRAQPGASDEALEKTRRKPLRAPLLIVVGARLVDHPKAPRIEQVLAAGMAAHAILLALHAQGYGAMLRTGDAAYDPDVKRALGFSPDDAIVGFIYAGTPIAPYPPIKRPDPDEFTEEWAGALDGSEA